MEHTTPDHCSFPVPLPPVKAAIHAKLVSRVCLVKSQGCTCIRIVLVLEFGFEDFLFSFVVVVDDVVVVCVY